MAIETKTQSIWTQEECKRLSACAKTATDQQIRIESAIYDIFKIPDCANACPPLSERLMRYIGPLPPAEKTKELQWIKEGLLPRLNTFPFTTDPKLLQEEIEKAQEAVNKAEADPSKLSYDDHALIMTYYSLLTQHYGRSSSSQAAANQAHCQTASLIHATQFIQSKLGLIRELTPRLSPLSSTIELAAQAAFRNFVPPTTAISTEAKKKIDDLRERGVDCFRMVSNEPFLKTRMEFLDAITRCKALYLSRNGASQLATCQEIYTLLNIGQTLPERALPYSLLLDVHRTLAENKPEGNNIHKSKVCELMKALEGQPVAAFSPWSDDEVKLIDSAIAEADAQQKLFNAAIADLIAMPLFAEKFPAIVTELQEFIRPFTRAATPSALDWIEREVTRHLRKEGLDLVSDSFFTRIKTASEAIMKLFAEQIRDKSSLPLPDYIIAHDFLINMTRFCITKSEEYTFEIFEAIVYDDPRILSSIEKEKAQQIAKKSITDTLNFRTAYLDATFLEFKEKEFSVPCFNGSILAGILIELCRSLKIGPLEKIEMNYTENQLSQVLLKLSLEKAKESRRALANEKQLIGMAKEISFITKSNKSLTHTANDLTKTLFLLEGRVALKSFLTPVNLLKSYRLLAETNGDPKFDYKEELLKIAKEIVEVNHPIAKS